MAEHRTRTDNSQKLWSLEAGRGIAAIMVVLFHITNSIFGIDKYFGVKPLGGFFGFGDMGVDFFFVLSGFIMYYVHRDDIGKPERVGRYAFRRLTRIYPIYWVATIGVLPFYFVFPHFGIGYETDPEVILKSFALFPSPRVPILGVAWSLRYEMLFYLLFGILIAWPRIGVSLLILWVIGIVLNNTISRGGFPANFLFNVYNMEFLVGIFSGILLRRIEIHFAKWLALLSIAAIILFGMLKVYGGVKGFHLIPGYAIACGILLISLVVLERTGKLKVSYTFRLLGAASYSIYLVHFPVLSLFAKIVFGMGWQNLLPLHLYFIIFLIGAVTAGIGFHLVIEKQLMRLWRQTKPSTA